MLKKQQTVPMLKNLRHAYAKDAKETIPSYAKMYMTR